MEKNKEQQKWHIIYRGVSTDASGEKEFLTESVRYFGNEQWEISVEEFSKKDGEEVFTEKMSTEELVVWVADQDKYARILGLYEHSNPDFDEEVRNLLSRLSGLYSAASDENAQLCMKLLKHKIRIHVNTGPTKSSGKNKSELILEARDLTVEEYFEKLYEEVKAFVLKKRKVEIPSLQMQFGIGYSKAARLMTMLEERGIVSSANNKGERKVLRKTTKK